MDKYREIFKLGRKSDATPVDIARGALLEASESLQKMKEFIKDGAKDMASEYFLQLMEGTAEEGSLIEHMDEIAANGGETFPADACVFDYFLCSACFDETYLAHEEGDMNGAWIEAIRTVHFAGQTRKHLELATGQESPAKLLAEKRHADSRALAKEAIAHWKENIDKSLSAQKAANELLKVVPLSHKKLAELISAEKKKQPK